MATTKGAAVSNQLGLLGQLVLGRRPLARRERVWAGPSQYHGDGLRLLSLLLLLLLSFCNLIIEAFVGLIVMVKGETGAGPRVVTTSLAGMGLCVWAETPLAELQVRTELRSMSGITSRLARTRAIDQEIKEKIARPKFL